ncbi:MULTISPECIES: hypothetical protein [Photorhabdus]|uniref:Uncharacterized protein n=1 Tax=Photorhabdus khanii NC19 TaxID=1004151 RepID=W3V9A6_9GAMM|nr:MULTISPECIES: hypothetical protein [Photorhabdus]ETS31695.1 hypothetical protein PTE_02385 [Photorhabdus khanii NC19]
MWAMRLMREKLFNISCGICMYLNGFSNTRIRNIGKLEKYELAHNNKIFILTANLHGGICLLIFSFPIGK